MTKHEADVIGGLNMTDQISNKAYEQIMIAAQEENEVGDVLDKIRDEIKFITDSNGVKHIHRDDVFKIIDKYRNEVGS